MQSVFVTGGSGFVAKHIVLELLKDGHDVVVSLRDPERAEEVRAALRPHLNEVDAGGERLRFVELDLMRDEGWELAMQGCHRLIHTASPFPQAEPRSEEEVVAPAVDGTLRALRGAMAAGVDHVVLTSSTYAITKAPLPAGRDTYTERDWSDPNGPLAVAYARSKTLAERAAWDFVAKTDGAMTLATINPGLVVGAPLDRHFGTSLKIMSMLLSGKMPMLPRYGGPVVDVADVAQMHVRALDASKAAGRRFIAAAESLWVREMAEAMAEILPDHRIVTREGPVWLMRLIARLDRNLKSLAPDLGRFERVSAEPARNVLGVDFVPAKRAVQMSARFLVENRLV